ncbi:MULTISPECIES: helix-turn-helix transcriptional regulator [unclassified Micromonospora]|uniref:helix-turn-helix transcriptional regulator n=1 Tax=unclassified Micromonospora TaxID=2617518 RepID=UPI003A86F7B3
MKNRVGLPEGGSATGAVAAGPDGRTRDRLVALLLERGAATAAQLGDELGLSPAAIRRHLDAMLADGDVVTRDAVTRARRRRGRPAKVFRLSDDARSRHGRYRYDSMAAAALRWIAGHGGEAELEAFAAAQVAGLEARCRAAIDDAGADPIARAEALAAALSAEGYAANASTIASGGQLCQHHCPVAHVAAEFPQLCEAETAVISRLIGTHVQRLATIAHGDGVCTTHIPDPRRAGGTPTVAINVSTDHVTSTVRTDR